MSVTPEQAEKVRAWAAEGASLSDIQTRLADECGVRLSYLDTRFLLLDLKVDLVEKTKKEAPPPDVAAAPASAVEPEAEPDGYGAVPPLPGEEAAPPPAADDAAAPAPDAPAAPSAVKVALDRIQRPGFAASGSITCSDGVSGEWGIDNYGRLALAFPNNKGYRPSAADQQAFMDELRNLLAGY